jgi:hypothetical protein
MPLNVHVLLKRRTAKGNRGKYNPNGPVMAFYRSVIGNPKLMISGYWQVGPRTDLQQLIGGYFYAHTTSGRDRSEFVMRIEDVCDVQDARMPDGEFLDWEMQRSDPTFNGRVALVLSYIPKDELGNRCWKWRGRPTAEDPGTHISIVVPSYPHER